MVLPLALTRKLPVGSNLDAAAHAAQLPRRPGSLVWRSRHVTAGSGMAMGAELPDALRRHRRQACENAAAWSRLVDDVRTQGAVHRPITNSDSRPRIADRGRGGPGNPGDREHLRVVPVVDAPASAPRGRQSAASFRRSEPGCRPAWWCPASQPRMPRSSQFGQMLHRQAAEPCLWPGPFLGKLPAPPYSSGVCNSAPIRSSPASASAAGSRGPKLGSAPARVNRAPCARWTRSHSAACSSFPVLRWEG
jgi:hypothetical protein